MSSKKHDPTGTATSSSEAAGKAGSERWLRVAAVFEAALEQPPERREALLREQCAGDDALGAEVRDLLGAHNTASDAFLAPLDVELAALLEPDLEDTLVDTSIGPYVVQRELGRGGMATVYLARDPRLERDVALKLLAPALSHDPRARERLIAEARAVSRLDHPNIAAVHDIGETADGRVWVAHALYRGETLRERIARVPLALAEACDLARQIAAGLAAAHARGIIHRDVKPANVIITPEGTAKVLDFGIAKTMGVTLTRSGVALGTIAYMSPEQTRVADVDARADVWALGVVLYEMLAGRRPFGGDGDATLIHVIRHDTPPPLGKVRPEVPGAVIAIVERCLEKDATHRFASMTELELALRGAAGGRAHAPGYAFGRRFASRLRTAGLALVAVATVGGIVLGVRARRGGRAPVDPAAASLLVLPFVPAVLDTSLSRLGSDLAITLARTLDGVDRIDVVDPVSMLSHLGRRRTLTIEQAGALARRLGVRSAVDGSVVRSGSDVRVDATLRDVGTGVSLATASITGSPQDLNGLTDGLAISLLRQVWRERGAPVPSLAAITTRSVAALRAYLEGERAIGEGRFRDAPEAFGRAIAADSTFWFAYWRLWYVRAWHDLPVDSTVRAAVAAHLDAFPEADRTLARARMAPDQIERRDILAEATRAFSHYWPAWFDWADWLMHNGPYHGVPLSESEGAFQKVVALNPDLAPAWEHLLWIAVNHRDATPADSIMVQLRRIHLDSLRAAELSYDVLHYYDYLTRLARSGGQPDSATADSAAALLATIHTGTAEGLTTGLHGYGYHRAQIDLLDRIARRRPVPDIAATLHYGRALSWAGRGAWDSALVAADRFARDARPERVELLPAQIAAVGALLGVLDTRVAGEHLRRAANVARARALAATRSGAAPRESVDARVELAWLEGIVAFTRRDAAALRGARERLLVMTPESYAPVLARSLAAFESAAAGRTAAAGDSLAAIEREGARSARQFQLGRTHPWATGVNRLLASRWLLEAGDTASAEQLLTFHENIFPSYLRRLHDANLTLAPLALVEEARIAAGRGDAEAAARLYTKLLERMDAPAPPLQPIREEGWRAVRGTS